MKRKSFPRMGSRRLTGLRSPTAAPERPQEAWELGQPVQSEDHLKLAAAVLRRLRKVAKRVSTPEHALENQKCQALCKLAMQEFEQKQKEGAVAQR